MRWYDPGGSAEQKVPCHRHSPRSSPLAWRCPLGSCEIKCLVLHSASRMVSAVVGVSLQQEAAWQSSSSSVHSTSVFWLSLIFCLAGSLSLPYSWLTLLSAG